MSFAKSEGSASQAASVTTTDHDLIVALRDGRSVSIPLHWYPRLLHATPEERMGWRLIDDGSGIHWESIDEDISVAGLLAGRRSGESEKSLARWRAAREQVRA